MSSHLAQPLAAQVITHTRPGESAVFYLLGILAVVAALGVVFSKNAVHAALALVGVLFTFAVFYAMQDAPFLAAVQIIVYAGAILMLFLFVLMLVGVDSADSLVETIRGQRLATAAFGLGFVVIIAGAIGHAVVRTQAVGLGGGGTDVGADPSTVQHLSNPQSLARIIFTTYFWPFEVISALLIVAAVGAMVLAHRERPKDKPTQAQLMRDRFRKPMPAPRSGPGVYAAGDSTARPALLPDGTPDRESVYAELRGGPSNDADPGGHGTESTP